jgi:TM2 domain-containing membrane protein YozV
MTIGSNPQPPDFVSDIFPAPPSAALSPLLQAIPLGEVRPPVAWCQRDPSFVCGIPSGWHQDEAWLRGISNELGMQMTAGYFREEPGTRWTILIGALGWAGDEWRRLVADPQRLNAIRVGRMPAAWLVEPPRCMTVGGEAAVAVHFAYRDDTPAATVDDHTEVWVIHQGWLYVLIYSVSTTRQDTSDLYAAKHPDFCTVVASWRWRNLPIARSPKNRATAGVLAILLGDFGVHKFYLGQVGIGLLYLVFSWTLIPGLLGLLEGITFLTLSDEDFSRRYGTADLARQRPVF